MLQRQKLIIELALFAHNCLGRIVLFRINSCETALSSISAIKSELIEVGIIAHISKFGQRIIIPYDAIIFIGNDKWYRYFGIVLEKRFVFSFVIEIISLVLSQTIESFVIG